jgi:hypothetical protein
MRRYFDYEQGAWIDMETLGDTGGEAGGL